jgi:tRNA (cytidine32/uridine32-2'-O)-methyltransferase
MLENIRIVLVNTSHPGNIGAAARAMKNMGLSSLCLVDPRDHPSYEAYSRAAGADDVLGNARVVSTLSEAIKGCAWVAGTSARERTIQWPMQNPRDCAVQCIKEVANGDVAIVFGRERTGLTNEELERCNVLVHIPTNPEYSSLNVAAAVQVVAYELRTAMIGDADLDNGKNEISEIDKLASADQLESMYQHFFQAMDDIGFLGTSNPEIIMRRLKGLFNRARVTQREMNILRGVLSAAQGRKSARKSARKLPGKEK